MNTENFIARLQQEIDYKTSLIALAKGVYVAQVAVLETPALIALQSKVNDAETAQKTAEDALAVATTTIGTLHDQITALTPVTPTPPVEVAPQVTPPQQPLS